MKYTGTYKHMYVLGIHSTVITLATELTECDAGYDAVLYMKGDYMWQ